MRTTRAPWRFGKLRREKIRGVGNFVLKHENACMLDDVERFADVFLSEPEIRSRNDDGPVVAFGVNDGHAHSGTGGRVDSHVLRVDVGTRADDSAGVYQNRHRPRDRS